MRVRVRVPREFSIDVRTHGGSIEVEDIEGDVETRTSGGRISIGRIEGDVELETSGGALEANQIDGSVRAWPKHSVTAGKNFHRMKGVADLGLGRIQRHHALDHMFAR